MVNPDEGIYPRIPGLVPSALYESMRGLHSADVERDRVVELLKEFQRDVIPIISLEWNVTHGPALYCLTRLAGLRHVVETGVCDAESTVSILSAMVKNGFGRLTSCDVNLPMRRVFRFLGTPVAQQNVDVRMAITHPTSAHLSSTPYIADRPVRWDFHLKTGVEVLRDIQSNQNACPPIDLFFHDSDHSYANQCAEYSLGWELVRPGGLVGGDDVEWDKPPWAFYELCDAKGLKHSSFGKGRMARKPGR